MKPYAGAAPVRFVEVEGADHWSVLALGFQVVARAIHADTGDAPALDVTAGAIAAALGGARP